MNLEDIRLRGLYYFPVVRYEQVQVVGAIVDEATDKVRFKIKNGSGEEDWVYPEALREKNPLEGSQEQHSFDIQEIAYHEEESKPAADTPYSNKVCVHPCSDKPADTNLIASGDIVTRKVMAKLLGISTTSLSYIEGVPCAGVSPSRALMYAPDKVIPYVQRVNTEVAAKMREYGLLDSLGWRRLWSLASNLSDKDNVTIRMAAWLLDYEVATAYQKASKEWKSFTFEDDTSGQCVHVHALMNWIQKKNRARYTRIIKTFPNLDPVSMLL